MMHRSFCQCGREHDWPIGTQAVCRCGRVLEPMTNKELETVKRQFEETLEKIAQAVAENDNSPVIRFFRD